MKGVGWMEEYTLNAEQIDDMKHSIGFEWRKVRKGVYEAYRNYYTTCGNNASWDKLVEQGLAVKRDFPQGLADSKIYFVSEAGIAFLEKMLSITIKMAG
jgi:hypothetical protein